MADTEAPATAVTAPVETPAVETPVEAKPAEPAKTYSQEEMDRITAKVKKNAAYRARKEAEAYFKGLQHGTQVAAPKPAEEAPAAPQEPKREQYADYESYLEARAEFRAERKVEERLAKDREDSVKRSTVTAQEKAVERFKQQAEDAAKEIPDFHEVMQESDAPLTDAMRDAIYETDIPARIAYHLAKNPDEARRIAALSSARQAVEIGRLEAKIASEAKPSKPASAGDAAAEQVPAKPVKEASKAPEPIKPVGGRATVGDEEPDASSQPDKWMQWRKRQVAAKLGVARKSA